MKVLKMYVRVNMSSFFSFIQLIQNRFIHYLIDIKNDEDENDNM